MTETIAPSHAVLEQLLRDVASYRVGGPSRVVPISALDDANRQILAEVLGEGEVSIVLSDGSGARAQEAVMPGIWRNLDATGESLEAADIPGFVRRAVERLELAPQIPAELPDGAMNVLPVLAEISAAVANWQPGRASLEINLSLLPMTPADLEVLGRALGHGPVTILSRGYGNCRIQMLGVRHCWRVTYYNRDDTMILDMIEIGDVPTSATAAQDDVDATAERIGHIMEAYFP